MKKQKGTAIKEVMGFSSAYPNICNLKLLPNIDGGWITIQDDVGTSITIKLSDLGDFICCDAIDAIKADIETYSFPEVFGEPIEMLIDGVWVKGKVINDYRSRDGIVNMETADGKKYWCGCERKDCYRQPKEGDAE